MYVGERRRRRRRRREAGEIWRRGAGGKPEVDRGTLPPVRPAPFERQAEDSPNDCFPHNISPRASPLLIIPKHNLVVPTRTSFWTCCTGDSSPSVPRGRRRNDMGKWHQCECNPEQPTGPQKDPGNSFLKMRLYIRTWDSSKAIFSSSFLVCFCVTL